MARPSYLFNLILVLQLVLVFSAALTEDLTSSSSSSEESSESAEEFLVRAGVRNNSTSLEDEASSESIEIEVPELEVKKKSKKAAVLEVDISIEDELEEESNDSKGNATSAMKIYNILRNAVKNDGLVKRCDYEVDRFVQELCSIGWNRTCYALNAYNADLLHSVKHYRQQCCQETGCSVVSLMKAFCCVEEGCEKHCATKDGYQGIIAGLNRKK